MSSKKCNKCKRIKNIEDFHKDSSRPAGVSYICKVCDKQKFKKWKTINKDKYNKTVSKWRAKNIDKVRVNARKKAKIYRLKHKEKIRKTKNKYEKQKMKTDIQYRNKKLARKRINNALKGKRSNQRTEMLIGCTIEYYIKYLSSKFKEGMNWDNQNLWEIDHIIPCCSFDLSSLEEQKKCFHYTNTQPLWKNEHKIKTHQDLLKYSTHHTSRSQ